MSKSESTIVITKKSLLARDVVIGVISILSTLFIYSLVMGKGVEKPIIDPIPVDGMTILKSVGLENNVVDTIAPRQLVHLRTQDDIDKARDIIDPRENVELEIGGALVFNGRYKTFWVNTKNYMDSIIILNK